LIERTWAWWRASKERRGAAARAREEPKDGDEGHTQNAERRTQNAERRTQNAERRTQNAERRTQHAERRTHRLGAGQQRRPLEAREDVAQEVGVVLGRVARDLDGLDLEGVAVLDAADVAREHVVREELHLFAFSILDQNGGAPGGGGQASSFGAWRSARTREGVE